jgi:hypothetical protein
MATSEDIHVSSRKALRQRAAVVEICSDCHHRDSIARL